MAKRSVSLEARALLLRQEKELPSPFDIHDRYRSRAPVAGYKNGRKATQHPFQAAG